MTREEMLAALTEIGTSTDEADRRMKLTAVTEAVTGLFDTNENLTAANTKFEADNKKLQEYNMQLFLKVGGQTKQPPVDKAGTEEKPDLTYEKLFNDKGELQ